LSIPDGREHSLSLYQAGSIAHPRVNIDVLMAPYAVFLRRQGNKR